MLTGVCELYRVVLLFEQTDKVQLVLHKPIDQLIELCVWQMHSFCIGLASDKRNRMMQGLYLLLTHVWSTYLWLMSALFAVKPSFAMFRKTMESISVEVTNL